MDDSDDVMLTTNAGGPPAHGDEDLPVVARLVVEIRSDGTRTIARGALQDNASGHSVAVRAEGTTPLMLSLQLARAIVSLPAMARRKLAELPGRPSREGREGRQGLRKAIRSVLSRRGRS